MTQINTKIDDKIFEGFREIIYYKYGLRKGDFKKAVEEAMLDYIKKHAQIVKS